MHVARAHSRTHTNSRIILFLPSNLFMLLISLLFAVALPTWFYSVFRPLDRLLPTC